RDRITHAAFRVEPEGRSSLKTAAERDEQIAGNVALREAHLFRLGAIHINVQVGLIRRLLNAQVDGSRDVLDFLEQLVGELPVRLHAPSNHLDVNRGWQAEVQDLAYDIGRQECECHPWKPPGKPEPKIVDVVRGRMM